jgi:hypothetical protein
VKNESAFLRPDQETNASHSPLAATPENPPSVRLRLFKPGMHVTYQGQACTVSHVVISRGQLLVNLQETGNAVDADKLQVEVTRILLQRS